MARARIEDDPLLATYATQSGVARVGDTKLVVTDTAGNPTAFDTVVRRELERAQVGQFLGILNVTAFGYNETRGPTIPGQELHKRHDIEPYTDDSNVVNPSFLEIERQQELDFLDLWLSVASVAGEIGWIFCAINKYDLWRDQSKTVTDYYSPSGVYGERIQRAFGHQFIAKNFETCATCASVSNFHGRAPKISGDFSQTDAANLNKIFCTKLEDRIKRR